MAKYNLIEYIRAMEIVKGYEDELKKKCKDKEEMCKCQECGMAFIFNPQKDVTRQVNNGGTSFCYGNCPYCDSKNVLARY